MQSERVTNGAEEKAEEHKSGNGERPSHPVAGRLPCAGV